MTNLKRVEELEKALAMLEKSNGLLGAEEDPDGFYAACIDENLELMERKRAELARCRERIAAGHLED